MVPRWVLTDEQRFFTKLTKTDTCWLWNTCTTDGYGYFFGDGRFQRAHRWAYKHFIGPIPEGLELDHVCHNPAHCAGGPTCPHRRCVNPLHLEVVTHRENTLRGNGVAGKYARATHCKNGHPWDEQNTYIRRSGARQCRACTAAGNRRRRASEASRTPA